MNLMPFERNKIEIACEVSAEKWGDLCSKYGSIYVDKHYKSLLKTVKDAVYAAIEEAELNLQF